MFRPLPRLSALILCAAPAALAAPPARESAKALIAEVEKGPAKKDAARDALAEAHRALTRADRARLAGDQRHGAALEALALEWAEAARDLARRAAAEERAFALEKELGEATVALDKARTLIEQTNARRNRAEVQLRELDAARAATPKPAPDAPPPKPAKAEKKKGDAKSAVEKGGSE
jgi:hypothetical protein